MCAAVRHAVHHNQHRVRVRVWIDAARGVDAGSEQVAAAPIARVGEALLHDGVEADRAAALPRGIGPKVLLARVPVQCQAQGKCMCAMLQGTCFTENIFYKICLLCYREHVLRRTYSTVHIMTCSTENIFYREHAMLQRTCSIENICRLWYREHILQRTYVGYATENMFYREHMYALEFRGCMGVCMVFSLEHVCMMF